MKITQIHAYPSDINGPGRVDLTFETGNLSVIDAISSVMAMVSGTVSYDEDDHAREAAQAARNIAHAKAQSASGAKQFQAGRDADAAAQEPATEAKATRTRRPRTNPDAAPAAEAPNEASLEQPDAPPIVAEGRRRRAATTEPEVKTISDADLTKAASNGAAIVGPEIIKIIMDELAVVLGKSLPGVSDIPADKREWFIQQIDAEVEAAKEELAKAAQ